jgi:hypothetical protein
LAPDKTVSAIFRNANTFTESAVEVELRMADLRYADTSAFFFAPEGILWARNLLNAHAFT